MSQNNKKTTKPENNTVEEVVEETTEETVDESEFEPFEEMLFDDDFWDFDEFEEEEPIHYPWYDDREPAQAAVKKTSDSSTKFESPQAIYTYLDRFIIKQEEAKKAASIMMYFALNEMERSNAMFVGPTGCGKTEIWRVLKKAFPDRIEIVDGSNITNDGWKGEKKWSTLFASEIFKKGKHTILVIDEADKMMSPKYTNHGENTSESIMAEGLKIMEGESLTEKGSGAAIDTSLVSIVFCGAFNRKAQQIAEEETGVTIGFGAAQKGEVKAYSRNMTVEDIIEYGVTPEFMGRISRLVNLNPIGEDQIVDLVFRDECGPLKRLEAQYRVKIKLKRKTCKEMVAKALKDNLGIRGVENQIREKLDAEFFNNFNAKEFSF